VCNGGAARGPAGHGVAGAGGERQVAAAALSQDHDDPRRTAGASAPGTGGGGASRPDATVRHQRPGAEGARGGQPAEYREVVTAASSDVQPQHLVQSAVAPIIKRKRSDAERARDYRAREQAAAAGAAQPQEEEEDVDVVG